ncbi:hypothetical protein T484DRAFT_1850457 [Baffinella frigidus]|nr:hypothetical protein T484DRAFT_1850457 [Cryptophyta sp. CCMP2293]
MQSHNSQADQINWPPNPKHYWRWRNRVSNEELLSRTDFSGRIKELLSRTDFAGRIKEMLQQSGRSGGY